MSMILKLFTFKHFDRFEKTLTRLDGLVPPNHKSRKKYSYSDSIAPKLLQTSVCCRIQQLDKVWSQSEHYKYVYRAENYVFWTKKRRFYTKNLNILIGHKSMVRPTMSHLEDQKCWKYRKLHTLRSSSLLAGECSYWVRLTFRTVILVFRKYYFSNLIFEFSIFQGICWKTSKNN